ncbi:MAG TPA: mechanosensitive ion channel domain-containing protein [Pirellulales bacterium]|nr:mechanosensitive ion channel domain-containing protein [Pirellulales bacterium]
MPTIDFTKFNTWQEAIAASFIHAFGQIIVMLPNVLAMLVVLVVGYIVAHVLDKFATALSQSLGLETAAERSGLRTSMKQVGIQRSVPAIVGQIVFWLTMCVFVTAAFNILGLQTVSAAMERIVAYIPNLLVATVVVVVGLLVAGLLRGVVATSADRVGISYAENLANGVYYVLALMTFIGAFDQLNIEFGLLKEMILIAFGGLALGFGLAFGLGGREVMGGILAGYYTRQRLHAGDRVHVAGMEGTVREVGPVATVIETEEDGLLNRHSVPNTRMLSEAVR